MELRLPRRRNSFPHVFYCISLFLLAAISALQVFAEEVASRRGFENNIGAQSASSVEPRRAVQNRSNSYIITRSLSVMGRNTDQRQGENIVPDEKSGSVQLSGSQPSEHTSIRAATSLERSGGGPTGHISGSSRTAINIQATPPAHSRPQKNDAIVSNSRDHSQSTPRYTWDVDRISLRPPYMKTGAGDNNYNQEVFQGNLLHSFTEFPISTYSPITISPDNSVLLHHSIGASGRKRGRQLYRGDRAPQLNREMDSRLQVESPDNMALKQPIGFIPPSLEYGGWIPIPDTPQQGNRGRSENEGSISPPNHQLHIQSFNRTDSSPEYQFIPSNQAKPGGMLETSSVPAVETDKVNDNKISTPQTSPEVVQGISIEEPYDPYFPRIEPKHNRVDENGTIIYAQNSSTTNPDETAENVSKDFSEEFAPAVLLETSQGSADSRNPLQNIDRYSSGKIDQDRISTDRTPGNNAEETFRKPARRPLNGLAVNGPSSGRMSLTNMLLNFTRYQNNRAAERAESTTQFASTSTMDRLLPGRIPFSDKSASVTTLTTPLNTSPSPETFEGRLTNIKPSESSEENHPDGNKARHERPVIDSLFSSESENKNHTTENSEITGVSTLGNGRDSSEEQSQMINENANGDLGDIPTLNSTQNAQMSNSDNTEPGILGKGEIETTYVTNDKNRKIKVVKRIRHSRLPQISPQTYIDP